MISPIFTQSSNPAGKLWLFTAAAVAAGLAIILVARFVPSFQDYFAIPILIVSAIWASLCLRVLLAGARRAHIILVLITLVLAVTLSLTTHWIGVAGLFLGYFGAILFLAAVLVFAAVRLFRKEPRLRALLFPVTMIAVGDCGVFLCAWSSPKPPPLPARAMSVADELQYIHDTDQSDRFTGLFVFDLGRDRIRLQRVKALYRAGQVTNPRDQYNAAMVFQHASCADDYQIAYQLASAAEAHGISTGHPPLSHQAYDRWQMALGKNQTYGTQLNPIPLKQPCPPGQQ